MWGEKSSEWYLSLSLQIEAIFGENVKPYDLIKRHVKFLGEKQFAFLFANKNTQYHTRLETSLFPKSISALFEWSCIWSIK